MKPERYKQRYKQMLSKPIITKNDVKEFNEAVEHYKQVNPNWKDIQQF